MDGLGILVDTKRGRRRESASDTSSGRVGGVPFCWSEEGGGACLVCTTPKRPSDDTDKVGNKITHTHTYTNAHMPSQ